eukprot:TRINITY_DN15144_c0_g1_i1.p2 TRINITY_DN15144_c0_g1~~TRINITY_DN15144_c0_g1_i1.p2  ORF type:complete len:137 (-),score=16.22 TRINITY_DN15144_c0_g1_i1:161-571(-)
MRHVCVPLRVNRSRFGGGPGAVGDEDLSEEVFVAMAESGMALSDTEAAYWADIDLVGATCAEDLMPAGEKEDDSKLLTTDGTFEALLHSLEGAVQSGQVVIGAMNEGRVRLAQGGRLTLLLFNKDGKLVVAFTEGV